jgi:cellulose synthase (UDP-forming)
MDFRRELALSFLGLSVVVVSLAFFFLDVLQGSPETPVLSPWHLTETIVFVFIIACLVLGNLVYQVARVGYLRRCQQHQPVPQLTLEEVYDRHAPRLCILIPSYKEEVRVLLQTILSGALMEYPQRRVVVLLDDPPHSTDKDDLAALNASRALVAELNETFATRARFLRSEHLNFMDRAQSAPLDLLVESSRIAQLYEQVAVWHEGWASKITALSNLGSAHTDRFFIEKILRRPASEHRLRADRLRSNPADSGRLAHEYRRLAALLTVDIESFERKRFANLSHQPNKAMNLNSYIGLIGKDYRVVHRANGLHLAECDASEATLFAPHADYLLTIDADSIVLPAYALRLLRIMEQDPRIAVAQTPYSTCPDAPGSLERIAGATTDIQYIVHQGFTWCNATYWVGANALLRLTALRDICQFVEERGHCLPVFIQDRTVIEDTGSTVDLIRRGWRLHNHPERLAYSATPPDFGSLLIQRRRWSNGGLIILPDLLTYWWKTRRYLRGLPEMVMRTHYLISPATGNLGLLILLFYRFDDNLNSAWLPLVAAPYYFLYGRDLRLAGYSWGDLIRVYTLNLMLLPVNLAGVLRSLQQLISGKKAAFGRTPKVQSRTLTPPLHVLFQWLLLVYLASACALDVVQGYYSHAAIAFANCVIYAYGITLFLGWREGCSDLVGPMVAGLSALRFIPLKHVEVQPRGEISQGVARFPSRIPKRLRRAARPVHALIDRGVLTVR